MHVYLVSFDKYPNLIKIGVAIDVKRRMKQLSKYFGKVLTQQVFIVGDNYKQVEKYLHKAFSEHNVVISVGDGGTEFFSSEVLEAARKRLEAICNHNEQNIDYESVNSVPIIDYKISILKDKLHVASERERNLAWKLLMRNYNKTSEYDLAMNTECLRICGAIELGFLETDVYEKAAQRLCIYGFTTPMRVRLAMKLTSKGGMLSRNLKDEISTLHKIQQKLLKIRED